MICRDLSNIAAYAKVNNEVFKVMKRNLPGPFTFVLPATNKLPNVMINRRKTIGIRIPDNYIVMSIVEELGNPLLTTSVKAEDEVVEYMTDPELIHEKYEMMIQKRDTEIMSLNIQMNPHFLYNSLNIINWVCLKGEQENASKMLLDLSRMLQYTSQNGDVLVPLWEDLDFSRGRRK